VTHPLTGQSFCPVRAVSLGSALVRTGEDAKGIIMTITDYQVEAGQAVYSKCSRYLTDRS